MVLVLASAGRSEVCAGVATDIDVDAVNKDGMGDDDDGGGEDEGGLSSNL